MHNFIADYLGLHMELLQGWWGGVSGHVNGEFGPGSHADFLSNTGTKM
ncbi:hypothetical protein [Micromonospora fulviviridis]